MELKVWVEGIQRVICGVSDNTTCQDVVVALAHATGKTGRFTLVEKWRDNERLLAPAEKPLKSLHKWGEYATDVQFILRHSDRNKPNHNDGRTEKFSHNFSPHQTNIKKSLTFSGAHSYSPRVTKGQGQRSGPIQENSSLESLDDRSSHSSTSPYASLEKQQRTSNHIPSKYGSLDRPKTKPKPAPRAGPAATSSPYGSLERPKKLQRSQFQAQTQNGSSPFNSLDRKHKQKLPTIHQRRPSPSIEIEEYDLDKNLPDLTKDVVSENSGFNEEEFQEKVTSSPQTELEDLVKLVGLQQERLKVQESQIKMINSEIHFWEERESEQDKQSTALNEEILRLETKDVSLTEEILEIDSVRWNDELEVEKQSQQTLQAELTLLRSKVSNCESELLQFKNKIQLISNEMEEEKREQSKYEQQCRESEIKTLQEIAELQKSINKRLMQNDGSQENLDQIVHEVKLLESAILEKKTQIADLENDIRNVNLELFMKVPISEKAASPSGSGLIRSRPGSARKMTGNPQSLGDAVPTAKNPHGMWV